MNSMTGYSYNEELGENYSVSVEIKSVNSRFLDLTINLPSFLGRLESKFKELITSKIQRGKIDVFIRIKENIWIIKSIQTLKNFPRKVRRRGKWEKQK